MFKFAKALTISLLVLTALVYPAKAQFESHELEVEGRIRTVLNQDLDGDGRMDIFIVHTSIGEDDEVIKWFTVFWQGEEGFVNSRSQTWEADGRAAAVDIGDVYGDAKGEIGFLAGEGIFVYYQNDGLFSVEPVRVVEERSLLGLVETEDIPVWNFIVDLNGDKKDDLIVPQVGVYAIYLRDGDGYRRAGSPQIRMSFSLGDDSDQGGNENGLQDDGQVPPLRVTYRAARLITEDFNRDGEVDLIAVWRDNLDVFLQKEGDFTAEPDERLKMEISPPQQQESDFSRVSLRLKEMNGDGILDIVGLKSRFRGPTDIQSQVQIFYGGGEEGYPSTPNKIIVAEGIADPLFQDLDANGVVDIIMPQMKFDLTTIIRVLTTRSIDMGLVIYLGDDEGEYPTKPSLIRNLSLGVNPFARRGGIPLFRMDGDFNGDNRPDMLVEGGEDELLLFWGGADGSPSPNAGLKLKVKKPDQVEIADLDGDGASDIIAIYEAEGNMIVLLSGK